MAVDTIWFFCLLSLGSWGSSVQEKPVWVELSCGAGPSHAVLEAGRPLLLDCHLGDAPSSSNVTWLQHGRPLPLPEAEHLRLLPNGSLLLLPPAAGEPRPPQGVEGGYSCVSAGAAGALTSRTIGVLLASLSRIHQDPEPQAAPVGGSARFQCRVDGVPTPLIAWEKDQVPISTQPRFVSLPSGVLQILEVRAEDAGSYRCVASNSARRRVSQEATLTVTAGPPQALDEVAIMVPPQNATVVAGRPAVMECMARGRPEPRVSWSRLDGKPIAADVVVLQTNLVIRDTRSDHAGVYVCRANKPNTREFVIAAAELHVPAPPLISQPPDTVSLSRGNTARFVCNSSGEPPPALRWLKNGVPVRPSGRVKTQGAGVLIINQVGTDDDGYYQCVADNGLGTACATAKLSVIVREGLPSAPRLLRAEPGSSTDALLAWDKPEHNSDQIIGYSVHYQGAAGTDNVEFQFALNNDTTEVLVKELQPHTLYTFYVVAYSPKGASRPSLPITVETLEDVPSAPPQLSLLSTSPTDIRVMWLPLSNQHSRGAITHYRIDYCTLDQEDRVLSVEVSGNETQFNLRELQPDQAYRLRMAAGTSAGFGAPSEWAQHHTPAPFNHSMVIFAPAELKVRTKMNALQVTWQAPPNHTQISGYKLQCREVQADRKKRLEAHTVKLRKRVKHHEVTGLLSDRQYEVKVWAFNRQTDGYPAVWKGRTEKSVPGPPTEKRLPPLPPSGVRASANSSTSIWLRWESPQFSSVRIINYTVRCSPTGVRNASLVSYFTSSAQEILLGALRPFTSYELAVQSYSAGATGPFSSTVEQATLADRPSTPPAELQLSALDSSSVLVSWRPPVEPNGIITGYRILYSGNLSQPDHLWSNLSQDGTITSVEVQGLSSGTRYFFKMGAATEVGAGPYSTVKDVHTPPQKYELDIHTVTGIIVGVCLGLLCILLYMCVRFRNGKAREVARGLDPSTLTPQYRRGAGPAPSGAPDGSDCHELETLMPPGGGGRELGPLLTQAPEEQSLMGPGGAREGGAREDSTEPQAWNGSVSRNWANRITRYRDTVVEDSLSPLGPAPSQSRAENGETDAEDRAGSSLCSNQVEAEVIVHSELSDPETGAGHEGRGAGEDSCGSRGPPLSLSGPAPSPPPEDAPETPTQTRPLANHNGQPEGVALCQGAGLTNGFHSPKPPRCGAEPLENGASRLRPPQPGKPLPSGLPPATPVPYVSSAPVLSTSAAHSYLCP